MTLSILDISCLDAGSLPEVPVASGGRTPAAMGKTVIVFLMLTLAAIAVNNIYALFAHGVSSAAMTWMFLYPLAGGGLAYFLILLLIPQAGQAPGYRFFSNAYNSGIATLTAGSFLKGILDIAGTESPYTPAFFVLGGFLILTGLGSLAAYIITRNRKDHRQS